MDIVLRIFLYIGNITTEGDSKSGQFHTHIERFQNSSPVHPSFEVQPDRASHFWKLKKWVNLLLIHVSQDITCILDKDNGSEHAECRWHFCLVSNFLNTCLHGGGGFNCSYLILQVTVLCDIWPVTFLANSFAPVVRCVVWLSKCHDFFEVCHYRHTSPERQGTEYIDHYMPKPSIPQREGAEIHGLFQAWNL